jgi:molybdenum cofactor cytidylyltransferase
MQQPANDAPGRAPPARAAVVLAAGASSRMGSPKALLPWAGTTLLGYAVRELVTAGAATIVVVLGADAERVLAALPDGVAVTPVVNPDYASGRSSSIRAGAAAVPRDSGALIVQSVDQPCPAEIIQRLYQAVETAGADLAIPAFDGRRGHPLGLAGRLLPELTTVREEDQGLRAVVRRHADTTVVVPVSSDVVHLNLNNPAAYAAAYQAERWR